MDNAASCISNINTLHFSIATCFSFDEPSKCATSICRDYLIFFFLEGVMVGVELAISFEVLDWRLLASVDEQSTNSHALFILNESSL
jgi:hypothetical protein